MSGAAVRAGAPEPDDLGETLGCTEDPTFEQMVVGARRSSYTIDTIEASENRPLDD